MAKIQLSLNLSAAVIVDNILGLSCPGNRLAFQFLRKVEFRVHIDYFTVTDIRWIDHAPLRLQAGISP